jgi:hypothetical protein
MDLDYNLFNRDVFRNLNTKEDLKAAGVFDVKKPKVLRGEKGRIII